MPADSDFDPEPSSDPRLACDEQAKPIRPCRRGKILVVDDDLFVRKVVQRSLASEHEVAAVSSAGEALARLAAGEHFDAIVCDLMMPAMTGMDLHARLTEMSPSLADRMVFLTGGAYTARATAFLEAVPNRRLEKPFTSAALRALLRERIG